MVVELSFGDLREGWVGFGTSNERVMMGFQKAENVIEDIKWEVHLCFGGIAQAGHLMIRVFKIITVSNDPNEGDY